MWQAKNKIDLMIEVWEKLDCESVGAEEIFAIEEAVRGQFGNTAVESPMKIARLLADEGAELRHSEIMSLYVERYSDRPYTAEFRNILKLDDLGKTLSSLRNLENLRRKFTADADKDGLRLIRERVVAAKKDLAEKSGATAMEREIAQWLTVWLQTPEAFDMWVTLRRRSPDFVAEFGGELNK
ncbi:MAG TPA: hypothetical protein VK612_08955 [Pyrinomonadaceae bacterium]|nr:hypothetical protein [Pyrinomonadaceae bacterium]